MPRKFFFNALKIAFIFFLTLFCASMIVLALLYIHDLVRHSEPSVKIAVWSLTGLGLFILAAAGLYLKGRGDASAEMMGRVRELKEHIVELQRFNLEMEKRLRRMDEEPPRQAAQKMEDAPAPGYPPSSASFTPVKKENAASGAGEKKFRWLPSWKFPKSRLS